MKIFIKAWIWGLGGFILMVGGCALFREAPPPKERALPDPIALLRRLKEEDQRVSGIRGLITLSIKRGLKGRTLDYAVVVERPSRFRLEGLDPFGTPLFSLLADGRMVYLYIPSERRLYVGEASDNLLYRWISLPLNMEGLTAILCGKIPFISYASLGGSYDPTEDLYMLTLTSSSREGEETIWIDPDRMVPLRVSFADGNGPYLRAFFEDYRMIKGTLVPGRINLEALRTDIKVKISLDDVEVNPSTGKEVFRLDLPEGVRVFPVESFFKPDGGVLR